MDKALDEILQLSLAGLRVKYISRHANASLQTHAERGFYVELDGIQLDCQSRLVDKRQMIFPIVLSTYEYVNVPLLKIWLKWKPPRKDAAGKEHMNMQQKLRVTNVGMTLMPLEIKLEDSFLNLILTLPMLQPDEDEVSAHAEPSENTPDHTTVERAKRVAPTPIKAWRPASRVRPW